MRSPHRSWIAATAVAVLGFALYLPRLGSSGLWDPWEPKYAEASREMAARGNWVVPYFHDAPRLNKPPVTYWLIAASQRVFGATEVAARLPSALFGVLSAVTLTLAFAVRRRELEGVLAGAALLTMPQWLLLGRFATPDAPLAASFGIATSAVVAATGVDSVRAKRLAAALATFAVVVAGLTDWPRGLLLPAWAGLAWGAVRLRRPWILAFAGASALYWAGQRYHDAVLNLVAIAVVIASAVLFGRRDLGIRWRSWLLVFVAVLVLVAPWFIAAWRLQPEELSVFKYKHAFNLGESLRLHRGPPLYPVRIVALGGLPWAAASVLGLLLAFRREERDELASLFGGAALGPLLFFALAEPKMGHFYGVMQPAVAGLAAIGIVAFLRKADWRAIPAALALAATAAAVAADASGVLEAATVKRGLFGYDLARPTLLAMMLWLVAVVVAKLARRRALILAAILPAAGLAGLLAFSLVPGLEEKKSIRPMWERYLAERGDAEPIAVMGDLKYGCFYYGGDRIGELDSPDDLERYLAGLGDRYLIAPRSTYDRVAKRWPGPGRWEVVYGRHPTHVLARYVREPS